MPAAETRKVRRQILVKKILKEEMDIKNLCFERSVNGIFQIRMEKV